MSDRMPRRNLLALIYFIRGLGFFGLLIVATPAQLYTVAIIGGIVWAGSIALSSAILADVYGIRLVGVLYGWTYLGHQIGGMISSWLGGWAYETFGTHWIAFGSTGVLLFVAGWVSLRLPKPGEFTAQPRTACYLPSNTIDQTLYRLTDQSTLFRETPHMHPTVSELYSQ